MNFRRKKFFTICLFCIFACLIKSIDAFEISEKGFKAGGNLSNTSGDNFVAKPKYKLGFVGGFYIKTNIDINSSIQTEILYSMKGYKIDGHNVKVDATFGYLEIPLLYERNIIKSHNIKLNFLCGPAFNYNVYQYFESTLFGDDFSGKSDFFKEFDIGLILGSNIMKEISNKIFTCYFRYEIGLLDWMGTEVYNRTFSVLIGISI